jgi:hypothetical protein
MVIQTVAGVSKNIAIRYLLSTVTQVTDWSHLGGKLPGMNLMVTAQNDMAV